MASKRITAPEDERSTAQARPRPKAATLVAVVWSGTHATSVPLEPGEVIVGRSASGTVVVDDASISRRHAKLVVGETITIEDLGSRNGTRVDNRALRPGEPIPFEIGRVAELGDVTLVLQRASPALVRGVEAPARRPPYEAVVADPAMIKLYELLDVVAKADVSVLILGETGTGKEVYVRELHRRSSRSSSPLVALSCASLPESMLEAEIFGYERGAFTGAVQAKPGLFESADGGTVFLDELGEVPLSTQAKLLRLIETGETMRLGSVRPKKVDVRLVSATHRDLAVAVHEGSFRADLFFRVNGFVVTLPALRARPFDITALAHHFAALAATKLGKPTPKLGAAAEHALRTHAWPGNVRELRNVIDRAVLLAGDVLEVSHLDLRGLEPRLSQIPAAHDLDLTPRAGTLWTDVDALERQRILETLERCAGNQTKAAKELGIGRGTLLAKLDAFGIARPRKK